MLKYYIRATKHLVAGMIYVSVGATFIGGIGVVQGGGIPYVVILGLGCYGCFVLKKYLPVLTGVEVSENRFAPLPPAMVGHGRRELSPEMYEDLNAKPMHDVTRTKMQGMLKDRGLLTICDAINLYFYDYLVQQPAQRRRGESAQKEVRKAQILGKDQDPE